MKFVKVVVSVIAVLMIPAMVSAQADVQFVQKVSEALDSGNMAKALAMFDSIPAALKDDVGLICLKASLQLSSGNVNEADETAKALLAANPNDIDVLELNVMTAKQKNDKKRKSALIKKLISLDPFNAVANIELGDEQALWKNWRNGRDYYKKALQKEPENIEALFGYGKMCYYREEDDEARGSFEKILSIDPSNPEANAYMGKLYAESKQYPVAKEYVSKAIAADPSNTDYYLDYGVYSRNLGKYQDAENSWKKITELDPDYFIGYAYLAGLYEELEQPDKALEQYRLVVKKNPKYYYAYESLGLLAWHAKSYEESLRAFEQARNQNPESLSYTLMICACYMKLNKVQELRKFTETVMKKQDRKSLDYLLVRMYHDKGGDAPTLLKVQDEKNRTKRGRALFYMALFYELTGKDSLAHKYYNEIAGMDGAMFFEYRLALWASQGK